MRQRPATGPLAPKLPTFAANSSRLVHGPGCHRLWQAAASCAHLPATPFEAELQDTALLTQAPPALPASGLAAHLLRHWGLSGRLSRLTSERDLNHRLDSREGRFVLRLSNPAEPEAMTDFQTRAHLHVARAAPALPVQRIRPLRDGSHILALPEGRLRVLGWLPGTTLAEAPRSPTQTRAIGAALAALTAALESFSHPAANHALLWDIRQLPALAGKLPAIPDPDLRSQAESVVTDFGARISPVLDRMPRQVVHADFNPHNLLVSPHAPETLTGILDFGDMVRTPRICDLAVAASYHAGQPDALAHLSALVSAYDDRLPLTRDEIVLLPDLITARLIATLTISAWRAALYPGNAAYILRNAASARAGLAVFQALGRAAVTACINKATGQE